MPDVKPGQIWQDCDKRSSGRKVRVIAVGETHATVEQVVTGRTTRQPRQSRIRLDRFRPTSTGYRLVSDGEARDA
ncbi:DUF6354 family protein [Microbispora rosea]|uniref:DUF6354 family protein n=1 Tax=Microbispora rosea TaxID=58117 RepID=UPI0004C4454F|nr:DUF6354 family protein [Microbispora rosea]